jgi:hypothetical protein
MSDPVLAEHMKQHMKATLNHMEASLKQAPESYGRFVTASSLVDYVLVGEVFKNIDHYRRSVFMRHMGDGTFKMGPLWDFNLAADNLWVYGQHSVQGFNILGSHYIDGNRPAFWFKDVFEVPAFRSAVKSRYLALRQPGQLLHTEVLLGKILSFRMYLQEAGVRHGKKWNPILHPVHGFVFHAPQWEQNVEDSITKLSYWLKNRLEWLDAHL